MSDSFFAQSGVDVFFHLSIKLFQGIVGKSILLRNSFFWALLFVDFRHCSVLVVYVMNRVIN